MEVATGVAWLAAMLPGSEEIRSAGGIIRFPSSKDEGGDQNADAIATFLPGIIDMNIFIQCHYSCFEPTRPLSLVLDPEFSCAFNRG